MNRLRVEGTASHLRSLLRRCESLIQLTEPFIDRWSWRESDVAAIARNFLRTVFISPIRKSTGREMRPVTWERNFRCCRLPSRSSTKSPGCTNGSDAWKRFCFLRHRCRFFICWCDASSTRAVAVWALVFYSFAPLSIAASRAFMPDLPSLTLSLAGLYFFLRWCDDGKEADWLVRGICVLSSRHSLIKGTSAIIGLPLLYLGWQRAESHSLGKYAFWILRRHCACPAAIWYWHAHQIAAIIIRITSLAPAVSPSCILSLVCRNFPARLHRNADATCIVAGARRRPYRSTRKIRAPFSLVASRHDSFSSSVVGYGNRHPWYQLPLVPIAAGLRRCRLQRDPDRESICNSLGKFSPW